jgi:hypothetical protein
MTRNSFRHNKLNPDPDTHLESDPVRDELDSKSSTIICETTMEIEEGNFSGSTTPKSGENLAAGKSAAGRPSLNAGTHTTDDDNKSVSGLGLAALTSLCELLGIDTQDGIETFVTTKCRTDFINIDTSELVSLARTYKDLSGSWERVANSFERLYNASDIMLGKPYDDFNELADNHYDMVEENADLILFQAWVEFLDPDLAVLAKEHVQNNFDANGEFIYPHTNISSDLESSTCLDSDGDTLTDIGHTGEKHDLYHGDNVYADTPEPPPKS